MTPGASIAAPGRALIVSFPADIHAICAQWGLRSRGIACDLLSYADFPACTVATYDPQAGAMRLGGPQIQDAAGGYSVVWNRRTFFGPPPAFVHSADWPQVERDRRAFVEAFSCVGAPDAAWINDQAARRRINSKSLQLRLAVQLGLEIPDTIVSNDPAAIQAFVARTGDCIVKPLVPMAWEREGRQVSMLTTPVTAAELTHEPSLRGCTMIYQAKVEKAAEYRVMVFGSDVVCVEIDSQRIEGAEIDWRAVPSPRLLLREVECPADLRAKLLAFMRGANLLFGAFDLARTPDGRFVFFEINEQGQFLWVEETAPQIRLLDRMVGFLSDPRPDWAYAPGGGPGVLTYEAARASDFVRDALAPAQSRHEEVLWNLATSE